MNRTIEGNGTIEKKIAAILAIHFDPQNGTPYWIEKAASLRCDPREAIRCVNDLRLFGFMDQSAMRTRPLADFVPRSIWNTRKDLIIAQTGGTIGEPIWTAYSPQEYESAFVTPFVAAARHIGFPTGGTWLYIGPSGPHVIGRAARSIALATGAHEPFTVDFDSRWAKKIPASSFAAERYLNHVVEQSLAVIQTQPITHLFTTPPVLAALGSLMSSAERTRIAGVHYGGMSIETEQMEHFQRHVFPDAVHLAGYGNTLFGCCLELSVSCGRELRYFPHGQRLLFATAASENDAASIDYSAEKSTGRCVFTRLDETVLIVNMLERDQISIIPPPVDAPIGFTLPGVIAPSPLERVCAPSTNCLY